MQTLIGFLQNGFIYFIACVILLGILIFVHELGHFLVARWCNVRVEVFSLGFGRKIWKKQVGDTTYCISVIPLGGYVKMFGDQPGAQISEEDRKVSFTHKTVWQRIAIVLAGPLMNLFFAVLVFGMVAMIGMDQRAPVLGDIESGTPAAVAGFQSGDRVLSIDGEKVTTYEDVATLMDENIGGSVRFTVVRPDGTQSEIKTNVVGKKNPNPLSMTPTIGDIEGMNTLSRASMVGVPTDSPLYAIGLRTGDRILSVGDMKVEKFRDLGFAFSKADLSRPVSIVAERYEEGKSPETLTMTLTAEIAKRGFLGLRLESPELYLAKVVGGSPAQKAGLQTGDRLIAVDGKPVLKWTDVLNAVSSYDGKKEHLTFDLVRDGKAETIRITPQITEQMTAYGSEDRRFTIGIVPWLAYANPDVVTTRILNPAMAIVKGAEQSWEFSVITLLSFVRLFQGEISHKTVGGLLSIGQAAGETMKMGLSKFLTMMAIISINLFILNLLPVPVLDGGHLVFYSIEAVKGSPLSLKKMEFAQQIGLVLLMGLMVFALYNDVTRLIFGRM
ncbi:MAG TPA: RIP metalloprotease RseP [Pseudobdellovibrionaceae bacterium]|nr:RIP metalloprotease RseP [Pseudobdellovibrionaceae bacterium]